MQMISLYRDPEGEKIFETTNASELGGVTNSAVLSLDSVLSGTNRITELESKIADLEAKLSQQQAGFITLIYCSMA